MESGMQASDVSAERFGEDAELAGYHTMCVWAIASLIFGLASPIVVLGPILLVVPMAGVAAAVAALRQIAASERTMVGRRAALVGLVLAVASSFTVMSHSLVTRHLRIKQADEYARLWIAQVLAGDTKQAYRIGSGYDPPQPTPTTDGPTPPDPFEQFIRRPAVKELLVAGPDAFVEDGGLDVYESYWGGEFTVRRRYVILPKTPSAANARSSQRPIAILLVLQRLRSPTEAQASWKVVNYDLVN